ncbi:MAG: hypothetical protein GVY19_05300 [Bacteroidetes bacterium]|jgi:HD superfamily phosphodiesterase|nr:hypothetical protein [Bacteroidota bacterium]
METPREQYKVLEEKWFPDIGNYFETAFKGTYLPSHDFTHHIRVWQISKQILNCIYNKTQQIKPEIIEQTFWSVMFHDLGMSETVGIKHGHESAIMFQEFINKYKIKPAGVDEILFAIKNHDNKNYNTNDNSVTTPYHILTLADDLEAFGYIGVYRYIEVYLLRGIEPFQLHESILKNLKNRYNHFQLKSNTLPGLIKKHTSRYELGKEFFLNLRNELQTTGYKSFYFVGHIGVLNYLKELVTNKANIFNVEKRSIELIHDAVLTNFFKNFFREVRAFQHKDT